MPIKVKTNISDLLAFPEEVEKEFCRKNSEKRELEASIVELIVQGKSPVKGKRWKDYSPEYAKRKRGSEDDKRPVDMTLTGKMLKLLKVIKRRNGSVDIEFKNKYPAYYHDVQGAGKKKVIRRLLPRDNEEFKASINRVLTKLLKAAIKRAS